MSGNPSAHSGISRREVLAAAVAASSQLFLPRRSNALIKTSRSVKTEKMDMDRFVEDCILANKETEAQAAVLEVLARAVYTPSAVRAAIGELTKAGIEVLLRSKTLTIFVATWTPQMNLMPHNHLMWANIGIFAGREDNIMWRKTSDSIEAFGAKALFEGDTAALPENTIHSVTNPLLRFTGGIHIYGGDFFDTTRSQWNPETLDEEPSDGAVIRGIFDRENERLRLSGVI
jgi:predicted metal-dependent enzyme (double-stranded beta helix superfamily)